MNKKIKELAKRATYTVKGANGCVWGDHVDLEKFAELIVSECANEIQTLMDCNTQQDEFDQGVYNGLDMAKDCIKQQFGVKE